MLVEGYNHQHKILRDADIAQARAAGRGWKAIQVPVSISGCLLAYAFQCSALVLGEMEGWGNPYSGSDLSAFICMTVNIILCTEWFCCEVTCGKT